MLAIPIIDVQSGSGAPHGPVVEGDLDSGRADDPLTVARRWVAAGFTRLHLAGRSAPGDPGEQRDLVREVLRQIAVPLQVDADSANEDSLGAWLDDGAEFVVAGVRGVEDPTWLLEQAAQAPGRIILAVDVRDHLLVSKEWNGGTRRTAIDLIAELDGAPLAGLLMTAVRRDGRALRTDLPLMEDVVLASPWPVIASGAVTTMQDLRNFEDLGAAAAVVGTVLLCDAIDARVVAEEFAS